MREPILDINTIGPERPLARINGELYECRVPEEFGLEDYARLKTDMARILEIESKSVDEWSLGDAALMSGKLKQFVKLVVVGLPEVVLDSMQDRHCFALVEAFGKAAGLLPEAEPQIQTNRATRRTGAKSSPRSNSSTVAPLATG